MMNFIHEQVQHKQYGVGYVAEQADTIIAVQFCDKFGMKKFLYPTAFDKFLVFCNPTLQEQINHENQTLRDKIEAERRHQEEIDKQREEERILMMEKKPSNTKRSSARKRDWGKVKKQEDNEEETGDILII